MKIIVNAISANTGGIVTYTNNLIEYLDRTDLEATIYVPRSFDADQFNYRKITVKHVPVRYFFGSLHRFFWEQFVWRRIVKDSGAEVLYSSANYGILFPPIKQILLVQGEIYLNPVYREKVMPHLPISERISAFMRRNLMLYSARHSEVTIFPSNESLLAALDYGPDIKNTSIVNFLAVNPSFYNSKEERCWKEKGTLNLLYVSVFYPHKDPLTLAKATKVLNNRGLKTKTHITMEPDDFTPWRTCKAELKRLQSFEFSKCVKLGRIDHRELSTALLHYDIFVFPSMAETFGFPMLEAMRAGMPLVVSDIPIHREICGDAALYFQVGNVEDLANKIMALESSITLRNRLTSDGKKRAEVKFTWERHISQFRKIVDELLSPFPIKILVNALHARTGGGVTYLNNMLPLLGSDDRLDVHLCAHSDQKEVLPSNLDGIQYHFFNFRRGFWNVLWREQVDLPKLGKRIRADVTFSPANYGPLFAKNSVVMIRNAVSVGFVERRPLKLAYWALLYFATLLSLVTSKTAIAVSDYAKRISVGNLLKVFQKKVSVVPHGVNESFFKWVKSERADDMLLAVSDLYVQKNFLNLIKAFSNIEKKIPGLKLYIAGRPIDQDYLHLVRELISKKRLQDKVVLLGHLNAHELADLYRKCTLFVFPSTVETFGNPLVEAMACGAPIVSSNAAAMPEVLGDAGIYFDPNSIESIESTIITVLSKSSLRKELGKKARLRAKQYSWHKTKELTVEKLIMSVSKNLKDDC